MPMPQEYRHAQREFDAFIADTQEALSFATRHMTYTTVQSVLIVFRRRLTVDQAIRFATVLPAVLRAIFIKDWDTDQPIRPFEDPASLNDEVKSIRQSHNFSPDQSIEKVATILWRYVDQHQLEAVLKTVSSEASRYWNVRV